MELLEGHPEVHSPLALATNVRGAEDRRLVRLSGAVHSAGQTLLDPLHEQPCVFYWLHVEGLARLPGRTSSRRKGRWQTMVNRQRLCGELWLDDGSARALVAPGAVPPRATRRLAASLPPRSRILPAELLRHLRRSVPGGLNGWARLRYRCYVVHSGEELALIGLTQRELDPNPQSAGDYRGRATRVRLVPPWFGALRVDAPGRI